MLRRALALADGRSESPWESVLRLLHVSCGVPVVPQHEVYDDGVLVARGDLWIRGSRMLHEYDSGSHLERQRQRADLRRGRRLANIGWAADRTICDPSWVTRCQVSSRSGVIGSSRTRIPVALYTALATAAAVPTMPISPIPRRPIGLA